ncbi:hypothetical protein VNO77_22540 [Canavalia gladiata]|uniref:Uncharacterized protein n=1 Tax=Canavalia gladiata TaxID=3824 RepID=A0AAN9L689_CANGL
MHALNSRMVTVVGMGSPRTPLTSCRTGFHATYAGYPDARKDRSSLLYTTPIKTCDKSNQSLGRVYAEIATSKSLNLGRDERPFKPSIETGNPHPDCR